MRTPCLSVAALVVQMGVAFASAAASAQAVGPRSHELAAGALAAMAPSTGAATRASTRSLCANWDNAVSRLDLAATRIADIETELGAIVANGTAIVAEDGFTAATLDAIPFRVPNLVTDAIPIKAGATQADQSIALAQARANDNPLRAQAISPLVVGAATELAAARSIVQNRPSSEDPARTICYQAINSIATSLPSYDAYALSLIPQIASELAEIASTRTGTQDIRVTGERISDVSDPPLGDPAFSAQTRTTDFTGDVVRPGSGSNATPPPPLALLPDS